MTFATRLLIQASSPRRDDRMLACSAHRRLCEDRKGFFDHLAPTKLAKSVRVCGSVLVVCCFFTHSLT